MIGIVNYGLGNIQAFVNIYKRLNIDVFVASSPEKLYEADKIILPGVGAFDWAMKRLTNSGLREALDELVIVQKRPVLGICVGMQIMAKRSDEGVLDGLSWIDAEVKKFAPPTPEEKIQLPHMGWNDVEPNNGNSLFKDFSTCARFYFLHSYYFLPYKQEDVLATTDYHGRFASCVCSGNVFGVQFHPEKSHQWGIQLLRNFAALKVSDTLKEKNEKVNCL